MVTPRASPEAIFAFYHTIMSNYCHIYCKLMLTHNSNTLQNQYYIYLKTFILKLDAV